MSLIASKQLTLVKVFVERSWTADFTLAKSYAMLANVNPVNKLQSYKRTVHVELIRLKCWQVMRTSDKSVKIQSRPVECHARNHSLVDTSAQRAVMRETVPNARLSSIKNVYADWHPGKFNAIELIVTSKYSSAIMCAKRKEPAECTIATPNVALTGPHTDRRNILANWPAPKCWIVANILVDKIVTWGCAKSVQSSTVSRNLVHAERLH